MTDYQKLADRLERTADRLEGIMQERPSTEIEATSAYARALAGHGIVRACEATILAADTFGGNR